MFTPSESISNEELVTAFNQYVEQYNQEHKEAIESGNAAPMKGSDADFIEKVSGIKNRYVINKSGILDPAVMCPQIAEYTDSGKSIQCEMGVQAAQDALKQAHKNPEAVDAVLVACTASQRLYPGVAAEILHHLGIQGFAFDMQSACSSMAFGIQTACDSIHNGNANCVLVISPEICTARVRFQDRESHFLFGDAAVAVVVERSEDCQSQQAFDILGTKLKTQYSRTSYNDFGFLNRVSGNPDISGRLFVQNGKKLFKEVVPFASQFILGHLEQMEIARSDLKRLWLHQANMSINRLVSKKVFGRVATPQEAPTILHEYGNTSSAGSIVAFHKNKDDLNNGDIGVLCAFGVGYSIGSVILRKR